MEARKKSKVISIKEKDAFLGLNKVRGKNSCFEESNNSTNANDDSSAEKTDPVHQNRKKKSFPKTSSPNTSKVVSFNISGDDLSKVQDEQTEKNVVENTTTEINDNPEKTAVNRNTKRAKTNLNISGPNLSGTMEDKNTTFEENYEQRRTPVNPKARRAKSSLTKTAQNLAGTREDENITSEIKNKRKKTSVNPKTKRAKTIPNISQNSSLSMEVENLTAELDDSNLTEVEVPQLPQSNSPKNKKQRGINNFWTDVMSFHDKAEAEEFIKNSNYSFLNEKKLKIGSKKYYRCNVVKRGHCSSQLYLACLVTDVQRKFVIRRNQKEHTHDERFLAANEMDEEVKIFIEECVKTGKRLMEIRSDIRENGWTVPSDNKLNVAIRNAKKKINKGFQVSLGAIRNFCEEHLNVPESDFEPFVLAYKVSSLEEKKHFGYIITTKTMMMNATSMQEHIAIDATYKVIHQKFPLVVFGSNDKANKFHPFGVAVVSSEKQESFEFVFKEFKDGVQRLFGVPYQPQSLLADGAKAIRNAFQKVFGKDKPMRICYFHMIKNVKKQMNKKETKVTQDDATTIEQQIYEIHQITDASLFKWAIKSFENLWKKKYPNFMSYFVKQWVNDMPGWYLGFLPGVPSTNNGIEGKNQSIKKYHTNYVAVGLMEANTIFLDMIKKWTAVYTTSGIKTDIGYLSKCLKKEAYEYAGKKTFGKVLCSAGKLHFYAGDKEWKKKIKTIADLEKQKYNVHVQIPGTIDGKTPKFSWEKGKCSCPSFNQENICKHIVSLGYLYNQITTDSHAMDAVLVGANPGPGRKKKVSSALIID